jgi:hypothetical protein
MSRKSSFFGGNKTVSSQRISPALSLPASPWGQALGVASVLEVDKATLLGGLVVIASAQVARRSEPIARTREEEGVGLRFARHL